MSSEQFVYWLQGYFEISDSNSLTEEQVKMIKKHLDLVFTNVTKNHNSIPKYIKIPHQENEPKYNFGELY